MIVHPKVVFVENPRTASSYIADILIKDGGERLTPRHGPLAEPSTHVSSFVVVRNPYQRAASAWKYTDEIDQRFPKLVDWMEGSNHPFSYEPQVDLTNNVDFVLKYETLSRDLPVLFDSLGLGHLSLVFNRPGSRKLRKVDKEAVQKSFKKDFTDLKYKV